MQMRERNMQKKCKQANNTIILRKWVDRPVQILFQHRTAWDEQFVPVFFASLMYLENQKLRALVGFIPGGFCNSKSSCNSKSRESGEIKNKDLFVVLFSEILSALWN